MKKPKDNIEGPTIPTLQWKSFNRIVQKTRVKIIFENIKDDSVLEIGCGEGHILHKNPATYKIGLDLDRNYLKRGKRIYNLSFICSDAENLPIKDKSVDHVLLPEVLEHLDEPKKAIAEARRVARTRVIVTVPNENRIWHSVGEVFDIKKLESYLSEFKSRRIIPVFNDTYLRRNIWLNRIIGRLSSLFRLDDFLVSRYEKSDSENSVFLVAVCDV